MLFNSVYTLSDNNLLKIIIRYNGNEILRKYIENFKGDPANQIKKELNNLLSASFVECKIKYKHGKYITLETENIEYLENANSISARIYFDTLKKYALGKIWKKITAQEVKALFEKLTRENVQTEIDSVSLVKENFSNFDIENIIFSYCNLTDCDFSNCKLTHATFKHCKLTNANFNNACLDDCKFEDCIFESMVFN